MTRRQNPQRRDLIGPKKPLVFALALSALVACQAPILPEEKTVLESIAAAGRTAIDQYSESVEEARDYLEAEPPSSVEKVEDELTLALDRLNKASEARRELSRAIDVCVSTVPVADLVALLKRSQTLLRQLDEIQGYFANLHDGINKNKRRLDMFETNELLVFADGRDKDRLDGGRRLYETLIEEAYIEPQGEIVLKGTILFAAMYEGLKPAVGLYEPFCELLENASPNLELQMRDSARKFRERIEKENYLEIMEQNIERVRGLSLLAGTQGEEIEECLSRFQESQESSCDITGTPLIWGPLFIFTVDTTISQP